MQPKKIIHEPTDNDPEKELKFMIYQETIKSMSNEELIFFLLNEVTEQNLYFKTIISYIINLQQQINELQE